MTKARPPRSKRKHHEDADPKRRCSFRSFEIIDPFTVGKAAVASRFRLQGPSRKIAKRPGCAAGQADKVIREAGLDGESPYIAIKRVLAERG